MLKSVAKTLLKNVSQTYYVLFYTQEGTCWNKTENICETFAASAFVSASRIAIKFCAHYLDK